VYLRYVLDKSKRCAQNIAMIEPALLAPPDNEPALDNEDPLLKVLRDLESGRNTTSSTFQSKLSKREDSTYNKLVANLEEEPIYKPAQKNSPKPAAQTSPANNDKAIPTLQVQVNELLKKFQEESQKSNNYHKKIQLLEEEIEIQKKK